MLLGSNHLLEIHCCENDMGPFLPLQIAVTCYIQHVSQEPNFNHCHTCSGLLRVESLSMPEMMWLWIKLSDLVSPDHPLTLLGLQSLSSTTGIHSSGSDISRWGPLHCTPSWSVDHMVEI
jgi:hypothetical protein